MHGVFFQLSAWECGLCVGTQHSRLLPAQAAVSCEPSPGKEMTKGGHSGRMMGKKAAPLMGNSFLDYSGT